MSNNQPLTISFIIPIYNVKPYLSDTIESILLQKVNKEIILVDDGSTDGSLDIALHYAKQYAFIKVVHSQNHGVSHARNLGLSIARGEYVYFLDGDDILDPDADFNFICEFAKKHHLNVIKGQFLRYPMEQPEQIFNSQPIYKQVMQQQAFSTTLHQFFDQFFMAGWYTVIGMFLIERKFLLDHQINFNENLSYGEDIVFNVDILSCDGKIAEIPMYLMHYRKRSDSAMLKPITDQRIIAQWKALQCLNDRLQIAQQEILVNCLKMTIAGFIYQLHINIQHAPVDVKTRFEPTITPEMLNFCQQTIGYYV